MSGEEEDQLPPHNLVNGEVKGQSAEEVTDVNLGVFRTCADPGMF